MPHEHDLAESRHTSRGRSARGGYLAWMGCGTLTAVILLTMGSLVAYHLWTEPAHAQPIPQAQLRTLAGSSTFPVLIPTWLPQGVALISATGGPNCTTCPPPNKVDFAVELIYAQGGAGPHLIYNIAETPDPTYTYGYTFVDPTGQQYLAAGVPESVQVRGGPATLHEYTYLWQGQTVIHALDLTWMRGKIKYIIAVQDVMPVIHANGTFASVQVIPTRASKADLIRMADSFQPARS